MFEEGDIFGLLEPFAGESGESVHVCVVSVDDSYTDLEPLLKLCKVYPAHQFGIIQLIEDCSADLKIKYCSCILYNFKMIYSLCSQMESLFVENVEFLI